MKKLYLLLTSSLILLTGVGTLTITVNGCTKGKETIYDALEKFNKNNPLEIIYDINNLTPKASDPKTARKIRYSLKLNNKTIFTDEVTKKINFESDQLKKDEPILVQATYEKKTTPIYVKEEEDIALWISNELEKWTEEKKNPLNIPYLGDVGKKPNDPEVSKLLRKILSSKSKYPKAKLWEEITFKQSEKEVFVLKPGQSATVAVVIPWKWYSSFIEVVIVVREAEKTK